MRLHIEIKRKGSFGKMNKQISEQVVELVKENYHKIIYEKRIGKGGFLNGI